MTERFIIPDGDLDTDVTLIDTSTGIEYEDNFKDIVDLMNTLDWSKQLLETQILHLKEDLDYFKSKCASLEEGLIREERKIAKLEKENKELKELVSEVDNELEIRDIVCGAGKFRLEEWGKRRYHQFYKGDEELEDETVVIMLMELEKEKKTLKKENEQLKQEMGDLGTAHAEEINKIEDEFDEEILKLKKENEQLKKQLDETIEGLHKEITTSENAFEGLMNENKELRDACKNYDWYKLYNQLLNENEQLKELIKEKCPLCGCDLAHYYKVNGKLEDLE